MADGVQRLEAPIAGTPNWFRAHFAGPSPQVELAPASRLKDFVVDGHLELSLDDYLELVLENSTDIAIQKLSIETPRNAITRAFARFDPTVTTSFRATRNTSPTADELQGADVLSTLTQPLSFDYGQALETGTSYTAGFSTFRRSTNSAFATVNPSIDATMDFSVTQPLLRNFGRRANRLQIMIAKGRFDRSRFALQERLLDIIAQAETAYWAVIDARESLRVSEDALGLADALLKRAERELELGAISPLDIYQPQQSKANSEIFVTQARFRLAQTLDALRRQMGADLDPDFQQMPVVLTEAVLPPEEEETVDPEKMVTVAMDRRPELRAIQTDLIIDDLSYDAARNLLKPNLSLTGFYSSQGLGGNTFIRSAGLPPAVIRGGVGDALRQVFEFNFPRYGFTLSLQLPVRDRRGVADMADAVLSKKEDMLALRQTQQNLRLAVLNAVNQLESSKARVKLAQTSLEFSQKRLDAEQKKYDLGVTTIFFLLDAQNSLAEAEAELVTQAAQYRRNYTQLLRVTGTLLDERGVVIQ